ncbi:MAG: dihydroorotate dehydrogenase electron transfer subunit [Chloroflexi bacterium]|nr:dihydroorotate dehydrogenase electron transfer subunit [Chloroflexota bacterium]
MQQFSGLVVENMEVMPSVFRLQLEVPKGIVTGASPGQFVHLLCSETYDPLLRRPFSFHRVNMGNRTVSLLYQVVGRGTDWLSHRTAGQALDALGPLGNGFRLQHSTKRLLLLGGGIGQAPLLAAAEEAVGRGVEVVYAAGARSVKWLLPVGFLPDEVEYRVVTDDGSSGAKGIVTDLLTELLGWPDQVFACGPEPMYQAMASIARTTGLRRGVVQISLEQRMACGVGACYSCVAETRRGLKKVCKDGPVFDLSEVIL